MVNKKSSSQNDDFFHLADELSGRFFVNNLHEDLIYHNEAMKQQFAKAKKMKSAIGMNVMAINAILNQNDLRLAEKYALKIRADNMSVLRERRIILLEEKFPLNGEFVYSICHKAPLYDAKGYIVGLYGYVTDTTAHQKMPDELSNIYKRAEKILLTLTRHQAQSQNPNCLKALLDLIENIEKNC